MTPLGIVCGALGSWVIVACAIAPTVGRAIKRADPGEDCYSPPTSVPQPDDSWMDLVPVDSLPDNDPLISERFFALVEGPAWFGGALTDPRRKLGGAA